MQIGDIDIANAIINLELRVEILDRVITKVVSSSSANISTSDIDGFRRDALKILQKKYPANDIKMG